MYTSADDLSVSLISKQRTMKKVFLLILTLLSLNARSQNHLLGIQGGVSATNVFSSDSFGHTNYKPGILTGLSYGYLLNAHFSLETGLLFNQRGYAYDVSLSDENGNSLGQVNVRVGFDYLSLPLKAGFRMGDRFQGFVNLGVMPSFLLSAKTVIPSFNRNGQQSGDLKTDITSTFSEFDLAGLAELGTSYRLGNRYWLSAMLTYQHSFTKVAGSGFFADNKVRHYGMALSLGLKYALVKE